MAKDLFGNEISQAQAHGTRPNGYADVPGCGPAGETCKTCRHIVRMGRGKVYRKCNLARAMWTHGPGTDILASSPACRLWAPKDEKLQSGGCKT